jgi:DMSO/TMAO reductase YedYZ molybdopterin-dependent catalytic subunit
MKRVDVSVRRARIFLQAIFCAAAVFVALFASPMAQSQALPAAAAASSASQLTISGDVEKPLMLSISDLDAMPQKTYAASPRDGKLQTYQGVLLSDLLNRAGAVQGGKLRGAAMATYVLAQGSDNYRVIFSIAELDSDFQDSQVLVADKLNDAPLGEAGPFRLIVPLDKRPARWVRNLVAIKVVTVPATK